MAKTVEQIANDLNLSITTVRLVLNGKGDQYRISAKTQKKLLIMSKFLVIPLTMRQEA